MPNNKEEKENVVNEENVNFVKDNKSSERVWWLVLIKYAVSYIVAVGFFFVVLAIKNYFTTAYSEVENLTIIADAFTLPAAIFILFSLLVLVARAGAFTGLLYALRHVGRMLLPFIIREDITYQEFLENRKKKRAGSSLLCFFIVGGTFLIGAIVFIILVTKQSA